METVSEALSAAHLKMLREESGISEEVIAARGYRTITDHKELLAFGFTPKQARVPGLLLPLHTTDGTVLNCVYRPDVPRIESEKERKYELKAGQGMRLDCPPTCREKLADPKKSDPDKRELLLAGNRKGSTIPVKEPGPDRTWRTRYVNTFCPRLFSATHLPDNILASRTIIIPLVRTSDKLKANSDPLDAACWPYDRRGLVGHLWSLALAHLAELPAYEARVNKESTLLGRHLEPWRALLAIALWLHDRGVKGLFQRMHDLATKYNRTRSRG